MLFRHRFSWASSESAIAGFQLATACTTRPEAKKSNPAPPVSTGAVTPEIAVLAQQRKCRLGPPLLVVHPPLPAVQLVVGEPADLLEDLTLVLVQSEAGAVARAGARHPPARSNVWPAAAM